ncbi:MAG: UDP-3-O-(3-hydroxymyristoyl)glucosamine N-acyltransferase [Pseudomonadota bacterium]
MAGHTVAQIADALGLPAMGDASIVIHKAAEPRDAGPDDLAMAMAPKYAETLNQGHARAAILWDGADWQSFGLKAAILAPRPRLAMAGVTAKLARDPGPPKGIHASAVIAQGATVGRDAAIGPHVVIDDGAKIGARARIGAGTYIGPDVDIGDDALIAPGVYIGHSVTIGDRFQAQPKSIIGGDGFSFVTPERSAVENVRSTLGDRGDAPEQSWLRIHSLGAVVIGDDVEIGAAATIDRGTIRSTTIAQGTKIDNLVQVGHNVQIGEDSLICAQSGVAGSTRIGARVVVGGQAGVTDNIVVGDDAVIGAAAKVLSNVPAGRVLMGYPAMKMDAFFKISRNFRRLPKLVDDMRAVKAALPGALSDKDE